MIKTSTEYICDFCKSSVPAQNLMKIIVAEYQDQGEVPRDICAKCISLMLRWMKLQRED